MAHGDRLSAKDITCTPPYAALSTSGGAWDIDNFAITPTEVIFKSPFNASFIKSLKSTRAYSSFVTNFRTLGDSRLAVLCLV